MVFTGYLGISQPFCALAGRLLRTGSDTKAAFTVMCSLVPSLLSFPRLVSVVMYPSGPSGPAMPKSKGYCFPLSNDSPIAVCRDPSKASRTLYRDLTMWDACPDLPSCTYADAGCGTPMGMQSWWLRQSAISMSRQPQQLLSQNQSSSKPGTAHQADPAIYRKTSSILQHVQRRPAEQFQPMLVSTG